MKKLIKALILTISFVLLIALTGCGYHHWHSHGHGCDFHKHSQGHGCSHHE